MRKCPTCNRTFEDTFTFCLKDGSILDPPYDPEATIRLSTHDASPKSTTDNLTTTLTDHEDGTATDSATDLMWMIPLVGQRWSNNLPADIGVKLSWTEATERFGRGRKIKVSLKKDIKHVLRFDDSETPALSRESYDEYQLVPKSFSFAGFHDWRLPTVEECFSLVKFAKEGGVFDTSFDLWTANSSNLSSESNVIVVRDWLKLPPECAWWLQGGDMLGDELVNRQHHVRLVRGGRIFSVLHGKHLP
jgi:hypothetical protein